CWPRRTGRPCTSRIARLTLVISAMSSASPRGIVSWGWGSVGMGGPFGPRFGMDSERLDVLDQGLAFVLLQAGSDHAEDRDVWLLLLLLGTLVLEGLTREGMTGLPSLLLGLGVVLLLGDPQQPGPPLRRRHPLRGLWVDPHVEEMPQALQL